MHQPWYVTSAAEVFPLLSPLSQPPKARKPLVNIIFPMNPPGLPG